MYLAVQVNVTIAKLFSARCLGGKSIVPHKLVCDKFAAGWQVLKKGENAKKQTDGEIAEVVQIVLAMDG